MRNTRLLVGLTGLAMAATTLAWLPPALADPGAGASTPTATGRGAATAGTVPPVERAEVARAAAAAPVVGAPLEMPTSYPYQPRLRIYEDNPDDAAHSADLLGHPDLAPKLMELMRTSDRVSTQVVGQSTGGRDLYLVTVTAPERSKETAQQAAWRAKIKDDPVAAAADPRLLARYKTPVWISSNIHGNEWEGTDAAMRYIEHLATADDAEVGETLRDNRLYFSLTLNPDGRTNATRATGLGLDANRDMITNTTPETRSFVRTAQAIQPIYAADFHGYTGVLQVEPCGPPHGSNYEYDLYLPHNYALSLQIEQDVVAADIAGNTYYDPETGEETTEKTGLIKIPYRDVPDGWDDFPPIFTAQYAAYFGAASSTVELPLTRGGPNGRQTPERAAVNTEVAYETMASIVGYLDDSANAEEMLRNQIETFRRGVAGEPKDALTVADVNTVPGPTQWRELWDVVDDQEPVTLPRAYVIPVGAGQRSASDAARLVRQLLAHDIEVRTLRSTRTVGGTTYPRGSYVVDMHQPLRGLANALLDLGDDISAKVPSMYDISAWSYSYTWGASVDKVGLTTDRPLGATTRIRKPAHGAPVPHRRGYLTFDVAGVADHRALNALLDDGVAVSMLEDGSAVVEPEGRDEAAALARELGVTFEPASKADLAALDDESTKGLADLRVGYVGNQDDRLSLTELGFDELVPVTVAGLEADPGLLADVDVLWIGGAFAPSDGSVADNAVQAYVDAGGSLVGKENASRGTPNGAFTYAKSLGLLSGTVVVGNAAGNGIVAVDTPAGSVLAPYAQDSAFIYPAYSFTGLGAGTTAEQTYAAGDPFLAGHWAASSATDGPTAAAGNASVVSSELASGAKALVFGTSPLFRTHPKGGLSQVARGLLWAGPAGEEVEAPARTTVTIEPVGPLTYPATATVRVTVSGEPGLEGAVALRAGTTVVATGRTRGGKATLRVAGLRPGTTTLVAAFTPHGAGRTVLSEPVRVTVRERHRGRG